RPSVGYPIVIDVQGRTAFSGSGLRRPGRIESPSLVRAQDGTFYSDLPPAFLQTVPYPPSQLAVESCPRPKNVLCAILADCLFSDYTSMHLPRFIRKRDRDQENFVDIRRWFSDTQMPF